MPVRRRTVAQGLSAASTLATFRPRSAWSQTVTGAPSLILRNGRITILDASVPDAEAVAIRDGLVAAVGTDDEIMRLAGRAVRMSSTSVAVASSPASTTVART